MTFKKALIKEEKKQMTTTENGMPMRKSSADYVVDFFYAVGAMRNTSLEEKLVIFSKAFKENEELAIRTLLWARDIRNGAGERDVFRQIIKYLCINNYEIAERILVKIPELGRWDDVLSYIGTPAEKEALKLIASGLKNKDALCAKWLPRFKPVAKQLKYMEVAGASKEDISNKAKQLQEHNSVVYKIQKHLGLTPTKYRKLLSKLSSTVEQQMCAKQWSEINYSHVPSIASKNYRKAFNRNDTERYQEYLSNLVKGSLDVKVNAGAIFPHDVIKPVMDTISPYSTKKTTDQEETFIAQQWKALPDFMNDSKVLPMIDTSKSMSRIVGETTNAMHVAFALGLYISERNKSAFKDVVMTFSQKPNLFNLDGSLRTKLTQLYTADWGMNTNIEAAFKQLLKFALKHKVNQEDMPQSIIILSDMQFDSCVTNNDSTVLQMIKKEYKKAGYSLPNIIFWNLNGANNVPVKSTKDGTALVSGYSPSILKSLLNNIDNMTPVGTMMKTIMDERYNF